MARQFGRAIVGVVVVVVDRCALPICSDSAKYPLALNGPFRVPGR
jgi:hypothetical protein